MGTRTTGRPVIVSTVHPCCGNSGKRRERRAFSIRRTADMDVPPLSSRIVFSSEEKEACVLSIDRSIERTSEQTNERTEPRVVADRAN